MPAMTRSFDFVASDSSSVSISIHEPSLTSDNLGLKTWTSSYQLSKRLLLHKIPIPMKEGCEELRVLELGAGTGLVGLAFASAYAVASERTIPLYLHLSDLGPIVPNLTRNVEMNRSNISSLNDLISISTGVIDWALSPPQPLPYDEKYSVVLAADPIYSSTHPPILTKTISAYLRRDNSARAICEMPIRDGYTAEVKQFISCMHDIGMVVVEEGEEIGYDDWGRGGDVEVRCWWSIWRWNDETALTK